MKSSYTYCKVGLAMDGFEELTLELTDRCPSRCLHCSSNAGPSCRNFLDKGVAFRLIDEIFSLRAKKVSLGGGEPTEAPSFLPILERISLLGLEAEIFTCGIRKQGNSLKSLSSDIVRSCQSLHGVKFIFSLYGSNAEVHDYITQTNGSFDLLQESLIKCLNANIECEINFVPMKTNFLELEAIATIAEDLNINRLSILRFVPQGRGHKNRSELELSRKQENCFVEKLLNLRSEKTIDIRTGSPFNCIIPNNNVPCRAGLGKLVVQANGNVLPCEVFKHAERCTWNLSAYQMRVVDMIKSTQILRLFESLRHSDFLECPVHSRLRKERRPSANKKVSREGVCA